MTPARFGRAAASGLVIAAAVLVVTWGLLFQKPLPTIDGYYRLVGLDERVEVARDAYGIPHIAAGTRHDMFFMQGYVTAQDRLAQMELLRRAARERTPEASEVASRATGPVREALEAYAAGVTKLISQHAEAGSLPGELALAGIQPAPWRAADSVAIGLARAPQPSTCTISTFETRRGRPILAADVFSDLSAPGWYEIGLSDGDARAIGVTIPGVPGIVAGHNAWTAWALVSAFKGAFEGVDVAALVGALDARAAQPFVLAAEAAGSAACAVDIYGTAFRYTDGPRRADVELMREKLGTPATGTGARVIVDLSDVDMSRSAVSSGASGHRTSPHFNDQAPLWALGQVHRLVLSRSAIGLTDGVLVFRPR